MKEFILKNRTALIILMLLIVGCEERLEKSKKEVNQLKINFSISGKIEGAENQRIYVEAPSDRGMIRVADTLISSSGSFKLEGNIPAIGYYLLRIGENQQNVIPITLVPGDALKINCTSENFPTEPNASGTKWSSSMNDYLKLMKNYQIDQENLRKMQEGMSSEEITIQYLKIKNSHDAIIQTKMLNDPSNPFNIVMSEALFPSTSFDDWDVNNLKILQVVTQSFETVYQGSSAAKTFISQLEQLQNAYKVYTETKGGTLEAPEISLNTPKGKKLKLSDLRGKIVLIDFWASWCGPCRKENPRLVKLYNKYKNKGFTILSVSLDDDPSAWKNAILTDGLIWPNHVSDLLGWDSSMISLYSFDQIPFTVLVNKEGKIIGKDLRGLALEQKLAEIIN